MNRIGFLFSPSASPRLWPPIMYLGEPISLAQFLKLMAPEPRTLLVLTSIEVHDRAGNSEWQTKLCLTQESFASNYKSFCMIVFSPPKKKFCCISDRQRTTHRTCQKNRFGNLNPCAFLPDHWISKPCLPSYQRP